MLKIVLLKPVYVGRIRITRFKSSFFPNPFKGNRSLRNCICVNTGFEVKEFRWGLSSFGSCLDMRDISVISPTLLSDYGQISLNHI